jgi:hypothetical protein
MKNILIPDGLSPKLRDFPYLYDIQLDSLIFQAFFGNKIKKNKKILKIYLTNVAKLTIMSEMTIVSDWLVHDNR